jgi:hypothetical protein
MERVDDGHLLLLDADGFLEGDLVTTIKIGYFLPPTL